MKYKIKKMSCTCNCAANKKKSEKVKKLEKVYNANIVTGNCICFSGDSLLNEPVQKGYYIKKLTDELVEILAHYDQIMQQDIDEVKTEKEKNRSQGYLYDMEIESIKYNYSMLKNAISVGYFIRTDI
jgi:hypothetical protein